MSGVQHPALGGVHLNREAVGNNGSLQNLHFGSDLPATFGFNFRRYFRTSSDGGACRRGGDTCDPYFHWGSELALKGGILMAVFANWLWERRLGRDRAAFLDTCEYNSYLDVILSPFAWMPA